MNALLTSLSILLSFSFFLNGAFAQSHQMEVLLERHDVIWGFDFLPDGKIIFTERGGALAVFDPKAKSTLQLSGVPKVAARGQGGLLDIRVHPDFQKNQWIYFTYSKPMGEKNATTALARAKLKGQSLNDLQELFVAEKANENSHHFGSRIEFDGKGHLFISVGDRGERKFAQNLDVHLGKIIRLREDGSIPQDNPFLNQKGAKPKIWSIGHRNPQGLTFHPTTGELFSAEFGPRGGDEVNLIQKGKNYGWPVITYGKEYWGGPIGEGTHKEGMEQPIIHFTPSISPSALTFYTSERIAEWNGSLFLANLGSTHLRRLTLKGKKVIAQEKLFEGKGIRFRNVRQGPDGLLYFSTDDGKLGRVIRR